MNCLELPRIAELTEKLKIRFRIRSTGSSPVSGTKKRKLSKEGLRFFVALPHNSMAK